MRNKTFVTAVFASFAWNLYLVGGVMLGASYALDRAAGGQFDVFPNLPQSCLHSKFPPNCLSGSNFHSLFIRDNN